MNAHKTSKASSLRYPAAILAVLLAGSWIASADNKKPAAAAPKAAPAKPAAAAAHPAAAGAARPGAAGAAGHTATPAAGHPAATPAAGHPAGAAAGGAHTAAPGGAARPGGAAPAGGAKAGGAAAGGRPAPAGTKTARAASGSEVRTRANGSRADVHDAKRGMDVHHGLNGSRSVRVERADHSRIVAERGGRGYVQHPYGFRGHDYGHRTYYEHGRAYDRFYRGYYYHGVYAEMYAPSFYYAPAFYGWAYNPWAVAIAYPVAAWGWAGNPWYGYYGGFFTPYPVYASASLWLTDYMISQSLAASYQAQVDAQVQAQALANPAPLTPQVKDLISAEVQRQIALENAEAATAKTGEADPASSGIQRMLTDNVQHVFVVGKDLDVVDAVGTECAVSQGDALQLIGQTAPNSDTATLTVLASKGGKECPKADTVSVALADLQDMQNHMRETISAGMGELQSKQGKGGLPALPPSANMPPEKSALAMNAPPPDPTASTQINQQWGEADKAEQEVTAEVGSGAAPGAAPAAIAPPAPAPPPTVNLSIGQTIDEVTAMLGQPKSVVDLGPKKIYVYKDMKVTFKDGKATDFQ